MSKIINWELIENGSIDILNATALYKFVVAPYNSSDVEHLFCVCYSRNEIRVFENCIERTLQRNEYNEPKYIVLLNKLEIKDEVDRKIINDFMRSKLFDLDFGPKNSSSHYIFFDDVPKQYPFPQRNGILSLRMNFKK